MSGLREQIFNSLSLKETDQLLEIWRTNDRAEWSDAAFEVIREILQERNVEIPEQNEPVYEHTRAEQVLEDGLEEWEARLLDEDNQPDFYDPLDVLSLRDTINRVAIAAVIVYALIGVFNIPVVSFLIRGMRITFSELSHFWLEIFITILNTGLRIVITYFSLKALTYILRILMEMEFRSRKGT